jgi:hypothetical protein
LLGELHHVVRGFDPLSYPHEGFKGIRVQLPVLGCQLQLDSYLVETIIGRANDFEKPSISVF